MYPGNNEIWTVGDLAEYLAGCDPDQPLEIVEAERNYDAGDYRRLPLGTLGVHEPFKCTTRVTLQMKGDMPTPKDAPRLRQKSREQLVRELNAMRDAIAELEFGEPDGYHSGHKSSGYRLAFCMLRDLIAEKHGEKAADKDKFPSHAGIDFGIFPHVPAAEPSVTQKIEEELLCSYDLTGPCTFPPERERITEEDVKALLPHTCGLCDDTTKLLHSKYCRSCSEKILDYMEGEFLTYDGAVALVKRKRDIDSAMATIAGPGKCATPCMTCSTVITDPDRLTRTPEGYVCDECPVGQCDDCGDHGMALSEWPANLMLCNECASAHRELEAGHLPEFPTPEGWTTIKRMMDENPCIISEPQCTCPSLAAGHMPGCAWKAAR